jgi:hypothetical protein
VKKVDYYAAHQPWRVPKWLGAALGVVFTGVLVGAGALIVNLTRPAVAAKPAVATLPGSATAAAGVVTAPPAVAAAPAAPAATASKASAPATVATTSHHHHHGHKSATPPSHGVAKAPAQDNSAAILARHDSREKRKAKDDLDKLLGGL